jgi:hypothetical protein
MATAGAGQGYRDYPLLAGFLALADGWVARATDDRGVAWFASVLSFHQPEDVNKYS